MLTVIGLTSSQGLTTATFENIGLTTIGGNHMMLRGYADVEERAVFERIFPKLSAGERERLYAARRRHKGAAVLLHELGHNLGAQHSVVADTLMYPIYSDRSAAFDADSRTVMLSRVDRQFGRTPAETVPVAANAAMKHAVFAVKVTADGTVENGGMVLSDAMLDSLLQMSFADDHDTSVVVKASKGAPHDVVVHVLDRAKAAGLTHMAIESN